MNGCLDGAGTRKKLALISGTPDKTIEKWKKGVSVPKLNTVAEFAQACNVSLDWLAYGKEVGPGFPEPETIHKALWSVLTPLIDHNLITVHDKVEREKLSRYLAKHLEEYHEAELAKRKSLAARMEIPKGYTAPPAANDLEPLPIYGVAAGSAANSLTISQEAMDHTERPEALKDETNAYALFVNGSSMAPLFRSGDTVYVCPDQEYSEGDYVIVKTQLYSSAPVMSYIKRFVGKTGDGVALKQLNPPADMEFKDSIITAIHRVVLAEELTGKKGP